MKNFSGLDYFILESCRKSLASKGIDLSHKQILSRIKKLHHLYDKFNNTQHSLLHLWSMYNVDPPYPPYNYCFEAQNDAVNFAKRVKKKYNINCKITQQNNFWRLTGDNE